MGDYASCISNRSSTVISRYFARRRQVSIFGITLLCSILKIDNITFALFSRFSVEDNIWGLHEILKMHCLWLNGTENLKVKEIYHLEEVSMVENWCEFFNRLERCVSFSTLFGA